jgi:hypothetical protein
MLDTTNPGGRIGGPLGSHVRRVMQWWGARLYIRHARQLRLTIESHLRLTPLLADAERREAVVIRHHY